MGKFAQYKALLWKNFLIKRRHPFATLLELLLPCIIFASLVIVKHKMPPEHYDRSLQLERQSAFNQSFRLFTLYQYLERNNVTLGFVPALQTQPFREFLLRHFFPINRMIVFDDEEKMNNYIQAPEYGRQTHKLHSVLDLSHHEHFDGPDYTYTLHMNGTRPTSFFYNVPSTYLPLYNFYDIQYHGPWRIYDNSGFMTFQSIVDSYILDKEDVVKFPPGHWNSTNYDQIYSRIHQVYPTPEYTKDEFVTVIGQSLGFVLVLIFVWSMTRVVTSFVDERETLVLFGQKMMGLSSTAHIASWATVYIIIFAIVSCLLCFAGCWAVYEFSSVVLIWLYYFIFGLTVFSTGYLLSSFFDHSKTASIWSSIFFILTFFISFLVDQDGGTTTAQTFVCLIPTACLSLTGNVIASLEADHAGIQFSSMFEFVGNFSYGRGVTMLLFDAILYFIIGLYLNQVIPAEYGITKALTFPCTSQFWRKVCKTKQSQQQNHNDIYIGGDVNMLDGGNTDNFISNDTNSTNNTLAIYDDDLTNLNEPTTIIQPFQYSSSNIQPTIRIRNLRKTYAPPTIGFTAFLQLFGCCGTKQPDFVAVKGLSLNVYPGVTCLLGANGAGKTTTFSMLSGLISATEGDAIINNLSMRNDMHEIYKTQGICFQKDVLYPEMTVWEHLLLYVSLKSTRELFPNNTARDTYLIDILNKVGLGPEGDNKLHVFTNTLSGGQKRKLSLALALLCDSDIIYLDEPCSSVDQSSARAIWDIILSERDKRTFVVITHDMNEAEALADTIAIISAGKLICSGSAMFLKEKFGDGYVLTINKVLLPGSLANDRLPTYLAATGQIPSAIVIDNGNDDNNNNNTDGQINIDSLSLSTSNLSSLNNLSLIRASKDAIDKGLPILTTKSGLKLYQYLIQKYPFVLFASDNGGEIKFKLPNEYLDEFSTLLHDLEANQSKLEIASFGIAVSSLVDVFLKVNEGQGRDEDYNEHGEHKALEQLGNDEIDKYNKTNDGSSAVSPYVNNSYPPNAITNQYDDVQSTTTKNTMKNKSTKNNKKNKNELNTPLLQDDNDSNLPPQTSPTSTESTLLTDHEVELQWNEVATQSIFQISAVQLWFKHLYAMYMKRAHIAKRDFRAFLWQLLYPSVVLLFGLLMLQYGIPHQFKPLTINPALYPSGLRFTAAGNNTQLIDQFYNTMENVVIPRYYDDKRHKKEHHDNNEPFLQIERRNDIQGTVPLQLHLLDNYHSYPFKQPSFGSMVLNDLHNIPLENPQLYQSMSYSLHFNSTSPHSLPAYNTMVTNTLLAMKNPKASITTISHPMPVTNREKLFQTSSLSLIISIAFSFIPASWVWFIVKERTDDIKHLQFINGAGNSVYWLSTFLWDLTTFIPPFIMYMALLFIFGVDILIGNMEKVITTSALAWMYIIASCPFVYALSFCFSSHTIAQNIILLLGFICSVVLLILSIALSILESTRETNKILRYFYRLLPSYCLGDALAMLMLRDNLFPQQSPWDMNILGWNVTFLAIDTGLYLIILLFLEFLASNNLLEYLSIKCRRVVNTIDQSNDSEMIIDPNEDEDVRIEREQIEQGVYNDATVQVKGLRKLYYASAVVKGNQNKPFAAVGNLYFHVENECFGLIGPNGCGKSTLQKLITNFSRPTSGDAIIGGLSVLQHGDKVRHLIGYVPQQNALFDLLTGREHFWLFARLKAIPEYKIESYITYLSRKVGILHLLDKPSGTYSGGNKRKLQFAIALFGRVLCIDEMSSGVDIGSRKQIWNLISTSMSNRSIILTSHDLEEIESLATRVGIMCSGRFRAFGTTQHIKSRHGRFYQIEISYQSNESRDKLHEWMLSTFNPDQQNNNNNINTIHNDNHDNDDTTTKSTTTNNTNNTNNTSLPIKRIEVHTTSMLYKVAKEYFTIAQIFAILTNAKKSTILGLISFTVSDTRLDQIFVDIVREDDLRRFNGQCRM